MHQAGLVPAFSVMMACTAAKHRIKTLNTFLQERQVHLPSSSLSFLTLLRSRVILHLVQ